jgi:hypothetical protein
MSNQVGQTPPKQKFRGPRWRASVGDVQPGQTNAIPKQKFRDAFKLMMPQCDLEGI